MSMPEVPNQGRPATERQREYARELGIEFTDNITRDEISKLIDAAQTAEEDERWNRLNELNDRESAARNELREEVLAEIDSEGCRLSKATPAQIVQALSDRELATILITMPWKQIKDFENLRGVESEISFSDEMTIEDVESVIMTYAGEIMKRKGIFKG